jgi:hypothetical protein
MGGTFKINFTHHGNVFLPSPSDANIRCSDLVLVGDQRWKLKLYYIFLVPVRSERT